MKYRNRKITINGIKFDSTLEGYRYIFLKDLENNGVIINLETQYKIELQSSFPKPKNVQLKNYKRNKIYSINYIADFKYEMKGEVIIEDTKGFETTVYKLKRSLLLKKLDQLGFTFREVSTATEYF